jgi:hypothetical protein
MLMSPKIKKKVIRVARTVRRRAEKEAAALGWMRSDLGGWCSVVSYAFIQALKKENVNATLVSGWYQDGLGGAGHFWVELEDQIIDLTATQFGQRHKVYVTDKYNSKYDARHRGKTAMRVTEDVLKADAEYIEVMVNGHPLDV